MVKRVIILLSILLISVQTLYSEVFTLDSSDNIQNAVDNASDGDTIILNPGVYSGAGNYNISIKGKSITIRSQTPESPSGNVILSAAGQSGARIFKINQDEDSEDTNVTLEGLYLMDASIQALICEGLDGTRPELTLRYCNISNSGNSNMTGGVVLRNTGEVNIIGSAIESNTTGKLAAGLYVENCQQLKMVKSVVRNNTCTTSGSIGGGIYIYNSEAEFDFCYIYGNSVKNQGGGVYIDNSGSDTLQIAFYNCVFSGNSANNGGGIYCYDTKDPKFINCVFYGNKNYGLVCDKSNAESFTAEVTNTIFWENSVGQINPKSTTVNASYSFVQDGFETGEHIYTDDPDFKAVGTWNGDIWTDPFDSSSMAWRLNFTSPCIDSGDPNFLPLSPESQDIDGDDRFIGFTVDPGIDEYAGTDIGKVYNSTKNRWYYTINDALFLASAGDELLIAPGIYKENIVLTADMDGTKISGYKPYNDDFRQGTILDGSNYTEPVILMAEPGISSETVITGFTIKGGSGLNDTQLGATVGGGIYCKKASPTISYCRIEENSADIGGGVAVINASPQIAGCVIKANTCQVNGSGIAVINNSSPKIYNCAINDNISGNEGEVTTGGLYCDSTSYPAGNIIRNCLFRDNLPYGLYYENIAELEVNSTIFCENTDPNYPELIIATNDNITLNYCDIEIGWEGLGTENVDTTVTFEKIPDTNIDHDYLTNISSSFGFYNSGDLDYEISPDEVDIEGNSRKLNCRIDIGPYEHSSPLSPYQNMKNIVIVNNSDIYCSVQEAIDAITDNKKISLTKGIFKENVIIEKSGVTITGSFVSTPEDVAKIVIDGSYKVMPDITNVEDPNDPNYQGAAVTLAYGKASNTTFQFLTLTGGWGSLDKDGKLNGGGISSQNNNNIKIKNCIIKNSSAGSGGGIYIKGADKALLQENIINNNIATETGGGVSLVDCEESYIATCQINKNQSNTASAVYTSESKTSIDFCTIADNTATEEAVILAENPMADVTIANSIIHNNSPQVIKTSGGDYKIAAEYSCISSSFEGDHILNSDPKFLDAANDNYRLSAYSPCVNTAIPAPKEYSYADSFERYYYKNTLQNTGKTRISQAGESNYNSYYNPNYDMGAFEVLDLTESLDHLVTPVSLYEMVGDTKVSRGDFSTISDAINAASPYSIIELEPGLYEEQIRISLPGITIRSKQEQQSLAMPYTIIKASDNGEPVVLLEASLAWDVTLEGMTIVDGGGNKISSDPNSHSGGGGIYSIDNSGLNMSWCTIAHNKSDSGGGISLVRCDNINMVHCLITNNTANRRRGAGIYLQDCYDFSMNYCTVSSNTANSGQESDSEYTQIGGMYLEGTYTNISIKNSIIWGNTPANLNKLGQDDSDITITNCVIPNAVGTDIIKTDPYFVSAASKDFHLRSPAGRYLTWYRKWLKDAVSNTTKSPAIDAADGTAEEKALELFPAGNNTNIGVYGASSEASLSYIKTITDFDKADINGDSVIDYIDLIVLSENWLSSNCFLNADRDKDCMVNMADMIQIAANWQILDEFKRANINNDTTIDFSDFAILTENWYNEDVNNTADRNKDGIVDLTDLEAVVSQWLANEEEEIE